MKRQQPGTDTIEFHLLPWTPNGKGTQFRRHTMRTVRAESQEDSTFPADGQPAILNKMNKKVIDKQKADEH